MLFKFKNYSGFVRCVQKERERERGGEGKGGREGDTINAIILSSLFISYKIRIEMIQIANNISLYP